MGRKSIPKNRKEKDKKVEQWTQAILPKLKNKDLGDLTMDDLAKLMNKSKSTIYQYFTTKEEVFEYITEVRMKRLSTYKNEISAAILTLDYNHDALVNIFIEGAKDISAFYLKQLQLHFPSAWAIIEGFLYDLINDLKEFYISGMKNNLFKPISVELLTKLDEYFIMQLIVDDHFFSQSKETLASMVKSYMALKFEGLIK